MFALHFKNMKNHKRISCFFIDFGKKSIFGGMRKASFCQLSLVETNTAKIAPYPKFGKISA